MGAHLCLFGSPRLLWLRLFWLRLRRFWLFLWLGLGLWLFLRGFRLFLQRYIANDVAQDVCQGDDAEQTSFPPTTSLVLFSLNYDQPMHPAFVDQLEKRSEGV